MDEESAKGELAELEGKFTSFLLNLNGQQIQWLNEARAQRWYQQPASNVAAAHDLFNYARMVGVNRSVAYRVIKAAIERADCAVPSNLNEILMAIYSD